MKILVTGGTGFVGNALARKLIEQGHEVVTVSRRDSPDLRELGASVIQGDISDSEANYSEWLNGVEAVFHTASMVSMWGKFKDFYSVNVLGTRRLLENAKKFGVKAFIYTSSPSVVADGEDLKGVDEGTVYPKRYEAHYPHTKALAEQSVNSIHEDSGMRTLSLRPHLIFGPGDTNLIPAILEKARSGKLKIIGSGENITDVTFIDDCVNAHIDALNALLRDHSVGGQPYFISQGEPVKMWSWINDVLKTFGEPPVRKKIPVVIAKVVAMIVEKATKLLAPSKEPFLTSFLVSEMSTDHYFNIDAAREKLGFSPKFTVAEALKKTADSLK